MSRLRCRARLRLFFKSAAFDCRALTSTRAAGEHLRLSTAMGGNSTVSSGFGLARSWSFVSDLVDTDQRSCIFFSRRDCRSVAVGSSVVVGGVSPR